METLAQDRLTPAKGPSGTSLIPRPLVRIIFFAMLARLVLMIFLYPARLAPERDHFAFGYESARIAASVVRDGVFASPMVLPTGPTAWLAPGYPLIEAAAFRMFGVYSLPSALFLLFMQNTFSALTCIPIFRIGEKTLGAKVGLRAAWFWAFFPPALYVANHWIWETALTTFLLTCLILQTLRLVESPKIFVWLTHGLLWGLTALLNPAVLSIFPFAMLWLFRRKLPTAAAVRLILAVMIALLFTVTPWFVRNWNVFGQFVVFRSNFGSVLRMGNSDDVSRPRNDALNPAESEDEFSSFRAAGEFAYVREKKNEALAFIRSHPWKFIWLTFGRAVHTWTEVWLPNPAYLWRSGWPAVRLLSALFSSLLAWYGLQGMLRALRYRLPAAWLYAAILFVFPLIYYLTWSGARFRHPIDPEIVLVATFGFNKESRQRSE